MKRYHGQSARPPFVVIDEPPAPPRPLTIVAYPYEQGQPDNPLQIAWWRGHDAAIRLAASLLVDACGAQIDPYGRDVLVVPQGLAGQGIVVEPVPTYIARAYAEAMVSQFDAAGFVIDAEAIRTWVRDILT